MSNSIIQSVLFLLEKRGCMENKAFDYYYALPEMSSSYVWMPRSLVYDELFQGISSDAKILYIIMLDMMQRSEAKGWVDDDGRLYIIFRVREIMGELKCATGKATKLLTELDGKNGVGLIERRRRGFGLPDLIYPKHPQEDEHESFEKQNTECCQNQEHVKCETLVFTKSKNKVNSNISTLSYKSDNQSTNPFNNIIYSLSSSTSNHKTIASGIEEGLEVNKDAPVEVDIRDIANIEVYEEKASAGTKAIGVRDYSGYDALIRENIDYDSLRLELDEDDTKMLEKLLRIMREVVTTYDEPFIRIAGRDMPTEVVRSRFLKLKADHIKHTIGSIRSSPSTIRNFKSYALTVLYRSFEEQDFRMTGRPGNHRDYGIGSNDSYQRIRRGWDIQREPYSWERGYTDEELRRLQIALMD